MHRCQLIATKRRMQDARRKRAARRAIIRESNAYPRYVVPAGAMTECESWTQAQISTAATCLIDREFHPLSLTEASIKIGMSVGWATR